MSEPDDLSLSPGNQRQDGPVATEQRLDALLCRLSRDAEARPLALSRLQSALTQLGPGRGEDLVDALQDCLESLLSPVQVGRLRLARSALWSFTGQPAFHPDLTRLLRRHSSGFLVAALADRGWLLLPDHPLHRLAACVASLAQGWSPDHVRAVAIADALADWLQAVTAGDSPETVLERAHHWCAAERQREQVLADRVREAELGGLRLFRVRQRVASNVARLLAGRQMPEPLARQVMDEWLPGLQWLLLQQGEQGAEWPRVTRLFGLLVWSVQPGLAGGAQHDKWQRVAAEVRSGLAEQLPGFVRDAVTREQMEAQLAAVHLALQQGHAMDYVDLPQLAGASLLDSVDAQLSRDLLDEIDRLSPDAWLQHAAGERIRLLLRDVTYQQLVFVNQAGTKSLSASFEEFALRLSTEDIQPVPEPRPLAEVVAMEIQALQVSAEAQAGARHQRMQREQAREQALAEAAAIEAHQAGASHMAQTAQADRARQRLRLAVSGLPLGSWVTFLDDGDSVRRKLTMILPSTGRYVFVDAGGHNQRSVQRDELVEELLAGRVVFQHTESRFDDALDRLVDGMTP